MCRKKILHFPFPDNAFAVTTTGSQGRTLAVKPNLSNSTDLQVVVVSGSGDEIFRQLRRRVSIAPFEIPLTTTPGRYVLSLTGDGKTWRKKIDIQ